MNEIEFRAWLQTQLQHLETIERYSTSLKMILQNKLAENNEDEYNNFFDCDDITYLVNLQNRLATGGDLHDFNINIQNQVIGAAISKYIKFLQYKKLIIEMNKYDQNKDLFPLNDAFRFYRIPDRENNYPVKAILRNIYEDLGLQYDYRTNTAQRKIKTILGLNDDNFFDINEVDRVNTEPTILKTKNIILYGSPGVGKTHNTNKLISLIENQTKSDMEIFKSVKNNINETIILDDDIKTRTKFITFHQSFGYEDFIEGFRPNEEGTIELADGVFKIISEAAKESRFTLQLDIEDISEKPSVWKISLGEGGEIKKECFENNNIRIGWDNYGDLDKGVLIDQREVRDFYKLEIGDIVFAFKNKWEIDGIGIIVGNYSFEDKYNKYKHQREVKWILKDKTIDIRHYNNNVRMTLSTLYKLGRISKSDVLEILQKEEKKNNGNVNNTKPKNYYLVIDEINRGNISKIFGELITLIEEDKRDNIEVTLPYSKKPFKIPSNLYIIGTMNSTDKSIALIDIALRRRFTFLKMKPNEDLITYENAKNIFKELNERINEDLGEDYQLGHSYFMNITNNEELKFVLEYKIIPLLEEYYYGDDRLKNILEIFNT